MADYKAIFFYFIFLSHFCFSGNGDTLKFPAKTTIIFFNSKQFEYTDSINSVENSLNNFQNYLPHNILGNTGLAFSDFFFQNFFGQIGFRYSKNNFENYFYSKSTLSFFDTHIPYTDLFYVIGSKKEQDFKMTFSFNVNKNWNITANFFRIRSEGFYLRQNTNDNLISFSSVYKSNSNRYNLLFGFMYNYLQNSENGGIASDSVFENGANLDKRLLDVNLSSAKRSHLNRSIFINQYINLGRKRNDTSSMFFIIPNSYLVLSTTIEDNLLKYEDGDPLSGFYSNIYYDSLQTYDSTYNLKFENQLSWKRVDNKKHRGLIDKFGIGVSVRDQFIFVKQREIDTVFNNVIVGGELFNTYSNNNFFYSISGKYCFTGYNKDDYSFNGSIKKSVFDSLTFLTFNISSSLQMPDFVYSRYSSNHFKWNNNFDKIAENSSGLTFSIKKYKLAIGVDYRQYSNPVYFDNYAIARQYNGSIPILSAHLKKEFNFYNWHLNNNIQYQYVPNSTIIRLPQFVLEHSLYYENDLFKNVMSMQIGASVFFASEYFANAYMPATAQFYLQDNKKYGNYPFIDFFINIKVKTVRVFFKIDHLNYGWMGNKYQMTPHYPMNDRAFKLGVSWRFYD